MNKEWYDYVTNSFFRNMGYYEYTKIGLENIQIVEEILWSISDKAHENQLSLFDLLETLDSTYNGFIDKRRQEGSLK